MNGRILSSFLELKSILRGSNFDKAIQIACQENPWFTDEMIRISAKSICDNMLDKSKLTAFINNYTLSQNCYKRVGIICAGNIPMVGFYDLLCACLSGHSVSLKPSSKDRILMEFICAHIDADIEIVSSIDRYDIDMLIATGSNLTADSILQQFKGIPSIIRHSRKSVAMLNSGETDDELRALNDDIFLYFGLGCRNISHLFLPHGYDFERLLNFLHPYQNPSFSQKVVYERALATMNKRQFVNGNNFLLLEKDYKVDTPLGCVGYSFYTETPILDRSQIQCCIGFNELDCNVNFGQTQHPTLFDAPDGEDVMLFLNSK